MTRKKKPLPPRRKRMNRLQRMAAAREWLTGYDGKRVVRSYARWFGVDPDCALRELQLLGQEFDPTYLAAVRASISLSLRADRRREIPVGEGEGSSDGYFAFIAGYTEGGLAYGITWKEAADLGMAEADDG